MQELVKTSSIFGEGAEVSTKGGNYVGSVYEYDLDDVKDEIRELVK